MKEDQKKWSNTYGRRWGCLAATLTGNDNRLKIDAVVANIFPLLAEEFVLGNLFITISIQIGELKNKTKNFKKIKTMNSWTKPKNNIIIKMK